VLEDLQWADQATVSFLDGVIRSLEDAPFLVIAVARPDVRSAHPRMLEGRGVDELSLGALTARASRSLVIELFGVNPQPADDLINRIVDRAAGNPFFLEELVRAARAGDASELPDSVLTILDARLDALPSDARRVLRAASVIGKSFWTSSIEKLVPSIDCQRELVFLERADVIAKSESSRFDRETEWSFRSAMLVDAAYARLPVKDRERAHLTAARWLEAAGEGDPTLLAGHFEKGGDPKSAVSLLSAAAQLALEATDLPQAVALAERAIRCGAQASDEGALREIVAEASLWLGKNKEALVAAREALALLEKNSPSWCRAAAAGAAAAQRIDDLEALEAIVGELMHLELPAGPSAETIVAFSLAAIQLAFRGRVDAAAKLLDRIPIEHVHRHPGSVAWVFRARAWNALSSGDPETYGMLMRRSAAAFDAIGDVRNACVQRVNVAYASMNVGQLEEAAREFEEVIATAVEMGLEMVAPVARHNLGLVLAWLGDTARAETEERMAIAAFEAQSDARMLAASWAYLARILSLRGDHPAAIEAAERAVTHAPESSPTRAVALASLSLVLSADESPPSDPACRAEKIQRALDTAEKAYGLLERLGGMDEGEELVHVAHVRALESIGRPADAQRAARTALIWLRERQARFSAATARATFVTRVPENAIVASYAAKYGEDRAS